MVKKFLQRKAVEQSIFITRTVRDDELLDLIKLLRPDYDQDGLIRIGGPNDGGYLLPNDLEDIQYCFSPGVGPSASFEEELAERGIESFLADYSLDAPPVADASKIHFTRKFIGPLTDTTRLTLGEWVRENVPADSGDLLLQMDIEGSEFPVLLETEMSLLKRFRIIVVEFHKLDHLLIRPFFMIVSQMFMKILCSFQVAHIHPNNSGGIVGRKGMGIPPTMEFTFIRKDRVDSNDSSAYQYPHRLDQDNVPHKASITLPKCWQPKNNNT